MINQRKALLEKAYQLLDSGVLVHDPNRLDIRGSLICGNNVEIDVNVIIEGEVVLQDGVIIGANCILSNSSIGANSIIKPFSLVEDSVVGRDTFIGPYARLRPGSSIGNNVQIGNFVEVKNSQIDSACRINHLTFIGDSKLYDNVTIGAGTITCNHNGEETQHTVIGENSYVGSGCCLVAPLKINSNSTIGAGSTITKDTQSNKLTIARSRQVEVDQWKKPKKLNHESIDNIK